MKRGLKQNNGYRKRQKLDPFQLIDNNDITQLEQYIKCVDINESYEKEEYNFYTLLSYACDNGHIDIVQLLLEQKYIDVNYQGPLYCACQNGHIDIVQLLLKRKDIDVNKWSPLEKACENGHTDIVRLLLKHPDILVNKWEPLEKACENGHTDIVRLLLKRKDIIITETKHVYNILLKLQRNDLLNRFNQQKIKEYQREWMEEIFYYYK